MRGARGIDPSAFAQDRLGWRRTQPVRWSEAIERNDRLCEKQINF
jgi:hypothetical protein